MILYMYLAQRSMVGVFGIVKWYMYLGPVLSDLFGTCMFCRSRGLRVWYLSSCSMADSGINKLNYLVLLDIRA